MYDLVDITRQQYQDLFAYLLPIYRNYTSFDCFDVSTTYEQEVDFGERSVIMKPICKDTQGTPRNCSMEELQAICNTSEYCIAIGQSGTLYRRNGQHEESLNHALFITCRGRVDVG